MPGVLLTPISIWCPSSRRGSSTKPPRAAKIPDLRLFQTLAASARRTRAPARICFPIAGRENQVGHPTISTAHLSAYMPTSNQAPVWDGPRQNGPTVQTIRTMQTIQRTSASGRPRRTAGAGPLPCDFLVARHTRRAPSRAGFVWLSLSCVSIW